MADKLKKYETIGCCGIDCGLCPRYFTKGESACSGCGGLNFKEKHPSCGFLTCCVIKKGFEVCSDCNEYPCKQFVAEKSGYDSFVTHKKVFSNLDFIKNKGIEQFISEQKHRMEILSTFLTKYDDGRSKSIFCISCALLPIDKLKEVETIVKNSIIQADIKVQNKLIKEILFKMAEDLNIDLKLNNKK